MGAKDNAAPLVAASNGDRHVPLAANRGLRVTNHESLKAELVAVASRAIDRRVEAFRLQLIHDANVWAHNALDVLGDVPDGWAKLNGQWFPVETVNWNSAARRGRDHYGLGDGAVLMPKVAD